MQVFKLCIKVLEKNKTAMLIYIFIFLVISVMISRLSVSKPQTGYADVKTDIAFLSEENTPLVNGLKQELSKSANFVTVADQTEALQDALYFRDVTYIVRIPKGFTERFLKGENVRIEKTTVPDSVYGAYLDMKINRYLTTAALYAKYGGGMPQKKLVSLLKSDLDQTASVTLKPEKVRSAETVESGGTGTTFTMYYFNYLAYVLPAVLIFGIGAIMQVFNNRDLSLRSFCSPITARNYNFQFLLANIVFCIVCWAILLIPCALLDPKHFFSRATSFLLLNSFAFLLSAGGLSYLIGNLVKNRSAISALSNVCSLGPSFIGGVFIPRLMLSDTVLKIASFTPTYWYVKANEQIEALGTFDFSNLASSYGCMAVEAGFAVAFLALGLTAGKKTRVAG
ncbi:MAG: ABC transporter permease [Oscillospiraceae bacterium]|jgi:ABC-2 type transport system permease protein|nr:ABC transporter permease [Oscillospiraceae bacterium]MCI1991168.1 ABC transporter permease [Oscillospiraceae bacterium]MCI2035409.1 ABC transporter permease [Oscillospiraceae bacterium]